MLRILLALGIAVSFLVSESHAIESRNILYWDREDAEKLERLESEISSDLANGIDSKQVEKKFSAYVATLYRRKLFLDYVSETISLAEKVSQEEVAEDHAGDYILDVRNRIETIYDVWQLKFQSGMETRLLEMLHKIVSKHPVDYVRMEAVMALESIGSRSSLAILQRAETDSSKLVRKYASQAIKSIRSGGHHRRSSYEEYGIFERILEASGSFQDTTTALEKAIAESKFALQGKRDLTYTDKQQEARVYVLTSPAYMHAAKNEAPNTISAQILRIGVYQYGAGKPTHIDITNPVAHAMVFYSGSQDYDKLIAAAKQVEQEFRDSVAKIPGKVVQVQLEPKRTEKTYNQYNGDGPAKMMTKRRNWEDSQRVLFSAKPEDFPATVTKVEKMLRASQDKGVEDSSGWTLMSQFPVGPHAVYFGISNQYTENRCLRINSDFRSEGRARDAPYPGVDHTPFLPLEVLVFNDGKETKVVQYGEMWRMQLYFWDSGYLAFAKNNTTSTFCTTLPLFLEQQVQKDIASGNF